MSRILFLILVVSVPAVWYSVHHAHGQAPNITAADVSDVNITPGESSGVIVAERGNVKVDQEAELATDQPGTLESIGATEGARVEKGEVIAKLRSAVAEAALAVAAKTAESDIDIRYARAAAEVAQKELEKSLEANRRNEKNVPEIEIDRLELSVERAKLQTEKATLDREIAALTRDEKQAELDRHTIRSPLDGIVTEVFKHPGEAVQQGDPILHVVNTDVVRVEGFVLITEASRIRPGDPVKARIDWERLDLEAPQDLAQMTFDGTVMFVDPTVDAITGDVRVWARVENPENLLKAGLPTTMTIHPTGQLPSVAADGESNS